MNCDAIRGSPYLILEVISCGYNEMHALSDCSGNGVLYGPLAPDSPTEIDDSNGIGICCLPRLEIRQSQTETLSNVTMAGFRLLSIDRNLLCMTAM